MILNKTFLRGDWPTPSAGEYGGSESGGLSGKLCLGEWIIKFKKKKQYIFKCLRQLNEPVGVIVWLILDRLTRQTGIGQNSITVEWQVGDRRYRCAFQEKLRWLLLIWCVYSNHHVIVLVDGFMKESLKTKIR